jgi:homoserine kinase
LSRAAAFAPGSIGNVGPGFDVLGLAVEGIGDVVEVALIDGPASRVDQVTGRDAALVPTEAARNVAVVAAEAWLRNAGRRENVAVSIVKGLALSGGMGGSAASSVAGAYAAALASGVSMPDPTSIIAAALAGEAMVSGRHLDNIAPSVYGGLTVCRSTDPIDVTPVHVAADWWVALVTPAVRVETRAARAILPASSERAEWIQEMANTTALACAFASGDAALASRALDDVFAEPRRASLIPHFHDVKRAALQSGAIGCSISGSGPTVFALAPSHTTAVACAAAMQAAFASVSSTAHVGEVARKGVRPVEFATAGNE